MARDRDGEEAKCSFVDIFGDNRHKGWKIDEVETPGICAQDLARDQSFQTPGPFHHVEVQIKVCTRGKSAAATRKSLV